MPARHRRTGVMCAFLCFLVGAAPISAQTGQPPQCVQQEVAIGQTRAGELKASDCAADGRHYHIYTLDLADESSLEIRNRPASGVNARVGVLFEGTTLAYGEADSGDAVVRGRFLPGRYSVYALGQPGAYTLSVAKADIRYPGLGLQIETAGGGIVVSQVFPNTPAANAGLRTGDRVTTINGVSTQGMTSADAANLMRGPVGGELAVRFTRNDGRETAVVLKRALIDPPPFSIEMARERAAAQLQAACKNGDGDACYDIGYRYAKGVGISKDPARAAELFRRGCDLSDATSCHVLGVYFYHGEGVARDVAGAAALFQRGCDAGYARSCQHAGYLYISGDGVPGDTARAAQFYARACEGGMATTCYDSGILYANGSGVVQDFERASGLYRRGCDAGVAASCNNLAILYANGDGVSRNQDQADMLYQRACDAGEPQGCVNLGSRYNSENRGIEGTALYERACKMGYARGCSYAGINYEHGYGGAPKDAARATAMYARFCEIEGKTECRVVSAAARNEDRGGPSLASILGGAVTALEVLSDPTGERYRDLVVASSPTLGALVQGAEAVLGGAQGGAAAVSPVQGGAAGRYPTRPMVTMGAACPGFTMQNYRTRAFEGQGDTQLFTMCGQAFEYYSAYLNAIRQGYSEADANRTFAAHEAAARNAISFYRNSR